MAPLDRALFPLLLILVNDEAPSVACTALRGLADCGAGLARVLAPRHVDALTNSLANLSTSRHWRVRCCAGKRGACWRRPATTRKGGERWLKWSRRLWMMSSPRCAATRVPVRVRVRRGI